MAELSALAQRLRILVGESAIVGTGVDGALLIDAPNEDALALLLRNATSEQWKVRIEGQSTWMEPDAPADIAVTTRAMTSVTYLNAQDQVATVQAGIRWSALRQALADEGAWVALDPPGDDRSLGSVVATGSAGPLRCGFGGIRDHLLGVTLVTGDGKIVRPGGQVVKNVAGFDLTKLAAGSFGAFGIVTSVTLRLRPVPRADETLVAMGKRSLMLASALRLLEEGITPATLELSAPDPTGDWTLAIRMLGMPEAVSAGRDAVAGVTELALRACDDAPALWMGHATESITHPITLRIGSSPSSLSTALDVLAHHVPGGWTSVSVFPGAIRWSGQATAERIALLRHQLAQQEMPLTLERAPWPIRNEVGHFGAYREQVGRLVTSLRQAFDPGEVLMTPTGNP